MVLANPIYLHMCVVTPIMYIHLYHICIIYIYMCVEMPSMYLHMCVVTPIMYIHLYHISIIYICV